MARARAILSNDASARARRAFSVGERHRVPQQSVDHDLRLTRLNREQPALDEREADWNSVGHGVRQRARSCATRRIREREHDLLRPAPSGIARRDVQHPIDDLRGNRDRIGHRPRERRVAVRVTSEAAKIKGAEGGGPPDNLRRNPVDDRIVGNRLDAERYSLRRALAEWIADGERQRLAAASGRRRPHTPSRKGRRRAECLQTRTGC